MSEHQHPQDQQPRQRVASDIFTDAYDALTLPTEPASAQFDPERAAEASAAAARAQAEAQARVQAGTIRLGPQP